MRSIARGPRAASCLAAALLLQAAWTGSARAASPPGSGPAELTRFEKSRGHMMLDVLKKDLVKYYYDPAFHGVDLDATFKQADDRIDGARSLGELLGIVAGPPLALDDSHTYFLPPRIAAKFEYGYDLMAIGDRCYVRAVQEGSDAAAKGLKRGDLVLRLGSHEVSRDNMWALNYAQRILAPRTSLPMQVVGPGESQPRSLDVAPRIREEKKVRRADSPFDLGDEIRQEMDGAYLARHRFLTIGEALVIWKMPQFNLTPEEVRDYFDRVRKFPALILDLRGNGGGWIETLERMVGVFVAPGTKIGDLKSRTAMPPLIARKAGELFGGSLVVLVDSRSASCSELFARTVQIAGRARLIGDRTMGAVMVSRRYEHEVGGAMFSASITAADITMTDGHSLENVGVTPDEILVPTAEDLAAGRDPVLVRAAELCGIRLDPEKAGGFFPVEWKR